MSSRLLVEVERDVATLTLNRPEKLNVMDFELLEAMESTLQEFEKREDLRIVVLRGAGDKAFSAGADIGAFAQQGRDTVREIWVPAGHRVFGLFEQIPQVSVAAIDGLALGGGLELALACDLRVSSERSTFALPELSLGTIPGWGGTGRLVDAIGLSRAKHMVLTAQRISAKTAFEWGLITELYPDDEFDQGLDSLLKGIRALSPIASALAKKILRSPRDSHTTLVLEALAASITSTTADLDEGLKAFKEKRQPQFGVD